MSLTYYLQCLKVTNDKVISKSNEYYRLLRIRQIITASNEDICSLVCIELAAMKYNYQQIVQKKLIQLSGSTRAKYLKVLSQASISLKINNMISIKKLCITNGCISLKDEVEYVLHKFKKRYLNSLNIQQQKYVNFSLPIYTVVAFYLVLKRHSIKIDKNKLAAKINVTNKKMLQMINIFIKYLPQLAIKKEEKKKKKEEDFEKKKEKEAEAEEEEEETTKRRRRRRRRRCTKFI